MDTIVLELLKTWGPPAIVSIVLIVFVVRPSEKREEAKDKRIQMLENLLIESYDERIEAANRMSEATHTHANALTALASKIEILFLNRGHK